MLSTAPAAAVPDGREPSKTTPAAARALNTAPAAAVPDGREPGNGPTRRACGRCLADRGDLALVDVLVSASHPHRAVACFRYRWPLRAGPVVDFDCCRIFQFARISPADRKDCHARVSGRGRRRRR
ncbi:hypothetical protein GCM10027575_55980 [Phytohabitans suffuscus]